MIIQIKVDIRLSHAFIKYSISYIVVIILVNNFFFKNGFGLPQLSTPAYLIMYLELVGPVHVRNNEPDHPSAVIEYAPE